MKKDLLRQKPENSAHPHHKFLGTFLGKFIKWGAPLPKKGFQRLKRPFLKFYQKNQTENQTGVPGSKKNWAALLMR